MKKRSLPKLEFKHFLSYVEVVAFIEDLEKSFPDLVVRESLGDSREGRALLMLTITDFSTGPAADKPAYLIHGNIHADELSGTHAALATASQLVLDNSNSDLLKRVAFYIVPRINPDGAEFVVKTSGRVRSRTDRSRREPNRLYQEDVNGDGYILTMRQEHPDGLFVTDLKDNRLLVRRTKDSKPPFYRTFPEGVIHEWDGCDNFGVEGRNFDWNRNWSYDWRPEPEQDGSGDFPFSEPELHALAQFIHSRPNLFGILGYHTGPEAVLRPPSSGSDNDLNEADVHVMQELAEIGAKYTGFPVVPVVKYHKSHLRDNNLRGHFHNFGYHHLGLFVFEFELGILLNSAGISTSEIFQTKNDQEYEMLMRKLMKWWDKGKKLDKIFMPWKFYEHSQLGRVEIGGLVLRHLRGPTLGDLKRIVKGTYKFTVEHALRHPWLKIEDLSVESVSLDIVRVRTRVANRGHLPTYISNKGLGLRRMREIRVELHLESGVELLSKEGHFSIGHLKGITGSRMVEWFLKVPKKCLFLGRISILGGPGGNVQKDVSLKSVSF